MENDSFTNESEVETNGSDILENTVLPPTSPMSRELDSSQESYTVSPQPSTSMSGIPSMFPEESPILKKSIATPTALQGKESRAYSDASLVTRQADRRASTDNTPRRNTVRVAQLMEERKRSSTTFMSRAKLSVRSLPTSLISDIIGKEQGKSPSAMKRSPSKDEISKDCQISVKGTEESNQLHY